MSGREENAPHPQKKIYLHNPYNQDEVNKKILKKYEEPRSELDLLGPLDLYRDEYIKCYETAKEKFKGAVKEYKRSNELALVTNRGNLCDALTPCNVLDDVYNICRDCANKRGPEIEQITGNGRMFRRRPLRHIHEVPPGVNAEPCYDAWFVRFLRLKKFKGAVYATVLLNRMLKRLEILRKLTKEDVEEFEKKHIKYYNVTYGELFEKFIR